jgi:serine/threonine protein kinase
MSAETPGNPAVSSPGSVLRELFDRAVDLPIGGRESFLAEACGQDRQMRAAVESLLSAHDRAGAFLAAPELGAQDVPTERFSPGALIGGYRLGKVIGEGGYGTVYLAQEEGPLRRRVALKVIKAGMDTRQIIARFELERQALARMDHPHIARVIDAGATESGRPYFIMELVEGRALTDFARERRLALRERLALFLDVCSGVRHAHQKGIIHRDLKPANVLVTMREGKGVAKIIDFGIAKALRAGEQSDLQATLTQVPQLLGTPQYMSPEQAAMGRERSDIDTRTDIYGLGGLLYELLTGLPPYDPEQLRSAGMGEIHRVLREVDPVVPSARLLKLSGTLLAGSPVHAREVRQLAEEVRGELDWIVMKAMEKEWSRRYETVEALAGDVERYLGNEAIAAGPAGWRYRARKWVRQHRQRLGIAAVLLVGLAGGIAWAKLAGNGNTMQQPIAPRPPAASQAGATPEKIEADLEPGVMASLYSGSDFEQRVTNRVDAAIDQSWGRSKSPAPGIVAPHYSIRWKGTLIVPPEGVEAIELWVDDGARLWIDDLQLLQTEHPGTFPVGVHLASGKHRLRLDYWNKVAQGHIQFRWKLFGGTMGPVPSEAFFHSTAATQAAP